MVVLLTLDALVVRKRASETRIPRDDPMEIKTPVWVTDVTTAVERKQRVQNEPSILRTYTNAEAQEDLRTRQRCDYCGRFGFNVVFVYTAGAPCHKYKGRCRNPDCLNEDDFSYLAKS